MIRELRRIFYGALSIALAAAMVPATAGAKAVPKKISISPVKGGEGTAVTVVYPSPVPGTIGHKLFLRDAGAHGWVVEHGAGVWIEWDPRRGLTYSAPAKAKDRADRTFTAIVPFGICGIVIKPKQATVTAVPAGVIQSSITNVPNATLKSNQGVVTIGKGVTQYPDTSKAAKTLQVWIDGQKSKAVKFGLSCDSYSLSAKLKAKPKKILVPPVGTSSLTGTFVAKGPAQFINGRRITDPRKRKNLQVIMPFKDLQVYFAVNPGPWFLTPAAGTVLVTDAQGQVHATVSSGSPGIAQVQVIATGLGDANRPVQFYTPRPVETPAPLARVIGLPPLPAPVRFHFDVSETSLSSHNGTLYGGGWGTQLRAGVTWNHIDDTLTWRNNAVSLQFPTLSQGWDESYWDDDLDYCWDDDFPDGQVAYIDLGASYQHLNFNDTGFPYSGNGFGLNTGFSLRSTPQLTEYGRITYLPTVTTNFKLLGSTDYYQFSKQQYDFGIRYRPSLNSKFFIEGGFSEDVLQGKNSQGGGIYNYGPYLGLGTRF